MDACEQQHSGQQDQPAIRNMDAASLFQNVPVISL
jgi:hypothetical protein